MDKYSRSYPALQRRLYELIINELSANFCQKIESVCFNIWSAYHHVIRELFPIAVLVVDRFHVVKLLNDVLDKFRRKLRRQLPNTTEFKSIKWALWKANLTEQQRKQIEIACQKSPQLASLVTLRNTFNHDFETAKTPEELEDILQNWIKPPVQFPY